MDPIHLLSAVSGVCEEQAILVRAVVAVAVVVSLAVIVLGVVGVMVVVILSPLAAILDSNELGEGGGGGKTVSVSLMDGDDTCMHERADDRTRLV